MQFTHKYVRELHERSLRHEREVPETAELNIRYLSDDVTMV